MDIKEYEELLVDLDIAKNKTAREAKDILEIKLNEFIDIQNDEMIDKITAAIDFVEVQMDVLDMGITLAEENAKQPENFQELKGDKVVHKNVSLNLISAVSGGLSQQQNPDMTGHMWFCSVTGDASINLLFAKAVEELKYKQWETAKRIFDSITTVELHNPGAYLGKVLATYCLEAPEQLFIFNDSRFEKDTNFLRAKDYSNEAQKKFIDELLVERDKRWKYEKAKTKMNKAKNEASYLEVASLFEELEDYSGAKSCAKSCRNLAEEARVREEKDRRDKELNAQINKIIKQMKAEHKISKVNHLYQELVQMRRNMPEMAERFTEKRLKECKQILVNKKRQAIREKIRSILVVIGITMCLMIGIPYHAHIFGFLPGFIFENEVKIDQSASPYFVSFGQVSTLKIRCSEIQRIFIPFSTMDSVYITVTPISGTFHAPKTEVLSMSVCDVEKIYLDKSTTTITVGSCAKLREIYVTENIKSITISSCPNAQIIWPEGFDSTTVMVTIQD